MVGLPAQMARVRVRVGRVTYAQMARVSVTGRARVRAIRVPARGGLGLRLELELGLSYGWGCLRGNLAGGMGQQRAEETTQVSPKLQRPGSRLGVSAVARARSAVQQRGSKPGVRTVARARGAGIPRVKAEGSKQAAGSSATVHAVTRARSAGRADVPRGQGPGCSPTVHLGSCRSASALQALALVPLPGLEGLVPGGLEGSPQLA